MMGPLAAAVVWERVVGPPFVARARAKAENLVLWLTLARKIRELAESVGIDTEAL